MHSFPFLHLHVLKFFNTMLSVALTNLAEGLVLVTSLLDVLGVKLIQFCCFGIIS